MRRKTGLRRTGELKRSGYLKRKTPVKKVNAARAAFRLARDFGPQAERCKSMDCCVCGRRAPSVPCHVRSRGAHGHDRANVVPMCWWCHDEQHRTGIKTFQRKREVDLEQVARTIAEQLEQEGVTW